MKSEIRCWLIDLCAQTLRAKRAPCHLQCRMPVNDIVTSGSKHKHVIVNKYFSRQQLMRRTYTCASPHDRCTVSAGCNGSLASSLNNSGVLVSLNAAVFASLIAPYTDCTVRARLVPLTLLSFVSNGTGLPPPASLIKCSFKLPNSQCVTTK